VITQVSNFLVRPLLNLLSEGWLMVSYQGHAAFNVLAHETILVRTGLGSLSNDGKPFLFFGMGCHVSDFLAEDEGRLGKSMGEELVVMPSRGAIATYGSSGFEFLQPNRTYMEYITRNFFERLQDDRSPGNLPRPPIASDSLESVWILGEQLAQSEMEILASTASSKEEMMAQYNLLGDPLLRMDEAPPRVVATADGADIADGAELVPISGTEVALALDMVDFAGVDRVEITDSEERDYSSLVQYAPSDDPRQKSANVALPVYPQGYTVRLATFDGSYRDTRPSVLNLVVPFELTVTVDEVEVAEGEGSVEAGAAVVMSFTSPVGLTEPDIEVTMDGGDLSALTRTSQSADGREWDVAFEVLSIDGTPQRLHLVLDGIDTPFDLSEQAGPATNLVLGEHYPFPNPAQNEVTFVAETSGEVVWCQLEVYDLGGRALFRQRESVMATPVSTGSGWRFTMDWNGRDNRGDDLANGVYLYRLEAGDGSRTTRSSMGRVVMMR
jgi:hypothetical protein